MTTLRHLIESARADLPKNGLEHWASVFFSLSVLTLLISLAASQTFFTLAGLLYAAHLLRHPAAPRFPPVKLPLALFCLTTLISMGWAENPAVGGSAVRKLVLFLILLLSANLVVTSKHLLLLYRGLFLEAALAGLLGIKEFIAQYRQVRAAHPDQIYTYMTSTRISGFMGHWMNFGGQQMLVLICLLAFLLLGTSAESAPGEPSGRRWIWILILATIVTSVFLNFTRGVWLGCFVAGVYLVARWRPRLLLALPIFVLAGYLTAPSLVRERFDSLRHPAADPSLSMRFEIWQAGLNMIRRHPWVGVGPNNINEVYTLYLPSGRQPEAGYHEHMHNDFLQFAAERGLPCLVVWLWFMGALLWNFGRIRRRLSNGGHSTWIADAAIAAWLAFMAEGFFEFNFGTSPVLMVFLFVVSTPFVAEKLMEQAQRR